MVASLLLWAMAGPARSPAVVVAAAAAGAVSLVGSGLVRRQRLRAARERSRARIAEAVEQLAAELAAGLPAGTALQHTAASWPELAAAARAHELGGDVGEALRQGGQAPGAQGLGLVAAAWTLGGEVGGSLQPCLSAVAARLRFAARRQRVISAELASARATGRLVSALPLAALIVGTLIGAAPLGFLLGGPAGWLCLLLGLGGALGGLWWIEAIADRADGEI